MELIYLKDKVGFIPVYITIVHMAQGIRIN